MIILPVGLFVVRERAKFKLIEYAMLPSPPLALRFSPVLVKAVWNLSMTLFFPQLQDRKETEIFILTFNRWSRISDGYPLCTFQQEEKWGVPWGGYGGRMLRSFPITRDTNSLLLPVRWNVLPVQVNWPWYPPLTLSPPLDMASCSKPCNCGCTFSEFWNTASNLNLSKRLPSLTFGGTLPSCCQNHRLSRDRPATNAFLSVSIF